MIEDAHQRELKRIEREAAIQAARDKGAEQRTINALNEKAALQVARAEQQEQERLGKIELRAAERTAQLRLETALAEVAADPDLSDFEKELKSLELRRDRLLSELVQ